MSKKKVAFDINPLLSGPSLESRARTGSPFRFIPLADIDVDPDQPRRVFDNERITELAESIREYGVLSPILVRVAAGGTYRLVAGERRLRACRMLGLEAVPAVIDADDEHGATILSKQLVENLQREDLTPMERAIAIGQLRDRFDLSIREIGAKLGISKSAVQRSLELLELPDDLQSALVGGASESKVLLLKEIEDRELRKQLLGELESFTRAKLQEMLGELRSNAEGEVSHGGTGMKRERRPLSVEDARVVEDLQDALRMKVTLSRHKSNAERGKLTIEFYSGDDLSELFDRLAR